MLKTYSPVREQPCVVIPIEVRTNLKKQRRNTEVIQSS